MKKVIAVLLAVLMAFTALTAIAYAAEDTSGDENPSQGTEVTTPTDEETPQEDADNSFFGGIKDLFSRDEDAPAFDASQIGPTIGFIFAYPLLMGLQGLLIVVFIVLDLLGLELSDLGISL